MSLDISKEKMTFSLLDHMESRWFKASKIISKIEHVQMFSKFNQHYTFTENPFWSSFLGKKQRESF